MAKNSKLDDIAAKTIKNRKNNTLNVEADEKRLTFIVSGADHLSFKKEAMDAGLSMTDYFFRLWKNNK